MQEQLQRLLTQRPVILQILRFGAIGVLNTAIDFIILNFISKTLGIESGLSLGTINVVGVVAALIQSYFWNRYWTFGVGISTDVVKNFWRLVVVGGTGGVGLIAVVLGARAGAMPLFYLIILVLFLVVEAIAWIGYGIGRNATSSPGVSTNTSSSTTETAGHKQFAIFVLVSIIGVVINSIVVAFVSYYLVDSAFFQTNADLLKNAAKVLATALSLIWNFVGYKLIVFKK